MSAWRCVALALALLAVAATNTPPWAVSLDKPGLPNLHKVSDSLYRGAQPTGEGFRQLQSMGIKTVVNLRSTHDDRSLLAGTTLAYERIPMMASHAETEDVVRFLRIVGDTNRAPVFVHCEHGADRTGMMCAIYRVVVEGRTTDEAIQEMTEGGFGFHPEWQNLIRYIRALDVEPLKKQAGLEK